MHAPRAALRSGAGRPGTFTSGTERKTTATFGQDTSGHQVDPQDSSEQKIYPWNTVPQLWKTIGHEETVFQRGGTRTSTPRVPVVLVRPIDGYRITARLFSTFHLHKGTRTTVFGIGSKPLRIGTEHHRKQRNPNPYSGYTDAQKCAALKERAACIASAS